jgi:hypothetical protein
MTVNSFVQVPPDSTGKQIATNVVGGKEFQAINLADDAGNSLIQADGATGLNTGLAIGGETAGGTFKVLEVNASGHLNISDGGGSITVDSPTLASETTLANVLKTTDFNSRIPALGQASMTSSQPVVVASDQSTISTAETATFVTGAAAQTAIVNNILTPTAGSSPTASDNFRSASVQVVSTGTAGTFIFEQSNDGVNFIALPVFNSLLTTGVSIVAAITATSSSIVYTFPVRCRFVRLRIVTTITGGSIQAFSRFSNVTWTPSAYTVSNPTAANLAATVTPVTPTTNFLNSAATTNGTVIKSTAGTLWSIMVSNIGAAKIYVKLYNSATVTVGTTTPVLTVAVPSADVARLSFGSNGIRFATGICLAITANPADSDTTAVAANEIKVATSYT